MNTDVLPDQVICEDQCLSVVDGLYSGLTGRNFDYPAISICLEKSDNQIPYDPEYPSANDPTADAEFLAQNCA